MSNPFTLNQFNNLRKLHHTTLSTEDHNSLAVLLDGRNQFVDCWNWVGISPVKITQLVRQFQNPSRELPFAKSSSTHGQCVALQQYFSHPRLVIYFFPTSPIKTKTGTAKGRRLLIATRLDQSNHLANQQQGPSLCLLPPSASCAKTLAQNHFTQPNQHVLTFLHAKFAVQCTMELL